MEEEIEILESIYPDELSVINDQEIQINLPLETVPPAKLLLLFTYPPEYPEEAVKLDIESIEDEDEESEDEDKDEAVPLESPAYHFNSQDLAHLKNIGRECAEENLGMPAVFSIVSQIKESAEDLYSQRVKEIEQQRLKEIEAAEAKEQQKFQGTPVTPQSFAEWRNNFRHEMGLDMPKERPFGRLTGKEIFERGLDEPESEDEDES